MWSGIFGKSKRTQELDARIKTEKEEEQEDAQQLTRDAQQLTRAAQQLTRAAPISAHPSTKKHSSAVNLTPITGHLADNSLKANLAKIKQLESNEELARQLTKDEQAIQSARRVASSLASSSATYSPRRNLASSLASSSASSLASSSANTEVAQHARLNNHSPRRHSANYSFGNLITKFIQIFALDESMQYNYLIKQLKKKYIYSQVIIGKEESKVNFVKEQGYDEKSFIFGQLYDLIKNKTYPSVKFFVEKDALMKDFNETGNIDDEMKKFFDNLNALISDAKKALKQNGVNIHFRNNTGHTMSNTLKYLKRSGRNMYNSTVKRFWGSTATIDEQLIQGRLRGFYNINLAILKWLTVELIKTNLKLNTYNAICRLFDEKLNKSVKNDKLISQLIYCRKELLKLNSLYLLIKDIIKRFVSLDPNNRIEEIGVPFDFNPDQPEHMVNGNGNPITLRRNILGGRSKRLKKFKKRGGAIQSTNNFSINTYGEIEQEIELIKKKKKAFDIKISITQMYNLKTEFNIISNLIKEYEADKIEFEPTLMIYNSTSNSN